MGSLPASDWPISSRPRSRVVYLRRARGRAIDAGPWFTTPLLRGEVLAERVAREGAQTLSEVHALLDALAGALGQAHARGIVHYDLTPENVHLGPRRPFAMALRELTVSRFVATVCAAHGRQSSAGARRGARRRGTHQGPDTPPRGAHQSQPQPASGPGRRGEEGRGTARRACWLDATAMPLSLPSAAEPTPILTPDQSLGPAPNEAKLAPAMGAPSSNVLLDHAGGGQASPFDLKAALKALGAVHYGICAVADPGEIAISFAPSGRVSTVSVLHGRFAQTTLGCLVARFGAARTRPFRGEAQTVTAEIAATR
jgi:hypothetical protein